MKLNAFVLIVLAVLALSAICNAGKKKPVQVIHVKNDRPPNQTESCGSNNTALKRSSLADDASSSPSSTNPPGQSSKKPKSGKKN
ncbi:hypothetical protein GPALN_011722 [Globodera pallida]|nr:hypothetical protein GPALN_011722 [Globodera pallida]